MYKPPRHNKNQTHNQQPQHQQPELNNFPNIKLSYETIIHKKVDDADVILALPEGIRCFAWFKSDTLCYFIHPKSRSIIRTLHMQTKCEIPNAVFLGTLFKGHYFALDDILYYNNNQMQYIKYLEKLKLVECLFRENRLPPTFGIPIMWSKTETMPEITSYKIAQLQYRFYNKPGILNLRAISSIQPNIPCKHQEQTHSQIQNQTQIPNKNQNPNQKIFKVIPDIQNDIYHLYEKNANNEDVLFDVAYIPDYKTSVMMNQIFRKIKENSNLDALEESDSEDEFENVQIDKFVHLNVHKNMVCVFNYKFKKWAPIRVSSC